MKSLRSLLEYKAYKLRLNSLKATTKAGSGHPTSALSAADIVSVLFFNIMHLDITQPDSPCNDHFILSKGHAAPVLYAAWHELGVISQETLLTLRQFDSVLEGHPTPRFPYIQTATGSLGIGLSIATGIALNNKRDGLSNYTYVLMGDMEVSEGSVWESAQIASFYQLDHLIGIIDINYLGQSTHTMEGYDLENYQAKCQSFGWNTVTVDGHDVMQLVSAFEQAKASSGKPTMILAQTVKGYGIHSIEGKEGYHGKVFSPQELPAILEELHLRFKTVATLDYPPPFYDSLVIQPHGSRCRREPLILPPPGYDKTQKVATRKAYGQALAACGHLMPELVCLDAEVKNSTYAETFEKKFPERFVQCFIAEQTMVGMGVGFTITGKVPFLSTFGAFFSRAHDQIRMAAIGQSPLRLVGSHAGVSIGQDGPSQMALEDLALMRSIPHSIIFYPCDAVSTYKIVPLMATYDDGISYLRTTRADTPLLYTEHDTFTIAGSKVLKQSSHDQACIIAAGITVFEALKAHEILAQQGIALAIIDCYSIKPLDIKTIEAVAQASAKRVITVEDHYAEGGLGEAICYALRNHGMTIEVLAVRKLPRSGSPEELLAYENIDASSIIEAVKKILKNT